MAQYEIDCYEECGRKTEVDLPYTRLDQEQLEAINKGEGFPVYPENMPLGQPFDQDWDDTDYREVCPYCGSDN